MEIEPSIAGVSGRRLAPPSYPLPPEKGSSNSAYLVWNDLTVVLPNYHKGETRKLLHGLSGFCEPSRIMAIMGPSGSGKSTLLDALAGRLARNVIQTGEILLNGKRRRLDYGVAAYVTQEDIFLGTLTVRETITYSASLRLPASMTKQEIQVVVDSTIEEMGLHDCADRSIGNWHLRGISGGEKKRLAIALEILTRPPLLFLDEPTSGLDSASAFFVTQTLRSMAHDGRTIVSSIHQPSSEVFELFDDLFLLSGGETIFFGDAKLAVQFFAEAGFPCPSRRSPSDHFLRCINSDFDQVTATLRGSHRLHESVGAEASVDPLSRFGTATIKSMLIEKYRTSEYATMTRRHIQEISHIEGLVVQWSKGSQATWWKQLSTLCRRSIVNMSRDMGYYWMRIVIYIVVAVCVGTIYFDVGFSYSAIWARASCGGFISGFMTFMSIGGFPSFVEEMKVFYRERLNGHYGVAVFILSNFLSSFPFLVAVTLSSGTITYYMVKFHPGFSHYLYFILTLFGCIAVIESLMMVVASLVPNFLMGIITGAGIMGIMMMTAGFFRLLPDLPKPFWRYPISYISYGAWALQVSFVPAHLQAQAMGDTLAGLENISKFHLTIIVIGFSQLNEGQYKNDMIGQEFDPLMPGDPKLKGEFIIQNIFGVGLRRSKWWDLSALYAILLTYRVLFFLILKFNEKASPFLRTLYAKRIIQHLKKQPSFRKKPSFSPSFRLSSVTGTSSPSHEYLTHIENPC